MVVAGCRRNLTLRAPPTWPAPLRWNLVLGYFTTATGFALLMRKLADRPDYPHRDWYYLGGGNVIALGMAVLHGLLYLP